MEDISPQAFPAAAEPPPQTWTKRKGEGRFFLGFGPSDVRSAGEFFVAVWSASLLVDLLFVLGSAAGTFRLARRAGPLPGAAAGLVFATLAPVLAARLMAGG